MNSDSEEAEQEFIDRCHTVLDDISWRDIPILMVPSIQILAHKKHSRRRTH